MTAAAGQPDDSSGGSSAGSSAGSTAGPSAGVEAAAIALVEAFASGDSDRYFACFSPEATFVFHTEPGLLADRAAYEQRWATWAAEGFAVLACRSFDRHVSMPTPDIGIFTHRVRTRLAGEEGETAERETIVFRRHGAEWVAVHEHLSPDPDPLEAPGAMEPQL